MPLHIVDSAIIARVAALMREADQEAEARASEPELLEVDGAHSAQLEAHAAQAA